MRHPPGIASQTPTQRPILPLSRTIVHGKCFFDIIHIKSGEDRYAPHSSNTIPRCNELCEKKFSMSWLGGEVIVWGVYRWNGGGGTVTVGWGEGDEGKGERKRRPQQHSIVIFLSHATTLLTSLHSCLTSVNFTNWNIFEQSRSDTYGQHTPTLPDGSHP